jgi:hypothetical protein
MSFSRFLAILLASLVAALGAIAALPQTRLARPGADIAWTASLYTDKERIAAAITGPRILAVGGSATLFSFDSETASRRLGMPVVNFGTHAGMGLTYILDRASRILRPGDIVLLAPEYELLQQGGEPNEHAIQYVTFYDRGYLKGRPLVEWPHYILGYGVLPSLVEGLKQLRKVPVAGRPDAVLDQLGNARGNTVALSKGAQLAGEAPRLPPPPVSPAAMEALRKFADAAARSHARILVIPPPLIGTPGYRDPAYRDFQSGLRTVYAKMGLTVLGDPALAFLAPEDMYDSVYHANDRGRVRYTTTILSFVCRAIACSKT